jgi:hypothetical protein
MFHLVPSRLLRAKGTLTIRASLGDASIDRAHRIKNARETKDASLAASGIRKSIDFQIRDNYENPFARMHSGNPYSV